MHLLRIELLHMDHLQQDLSSSTISRILVLLNLPFHRLPRPWLPNILHTTIIKAVLLLSHLLQPFCLKIVRDLEEEEEEEEEVPLQHHTQELEVPTININTNINHTEDLHLRLRLIKLLMPNTNPLLIISNSRVVRLLQSHLHIIIDHLHHLDLLMTMVLRAVMDPLHKEGFLHQSLIKDIIEVCLRFPFPRCCP